MADRRKDLPPVNSAQFQQQVREAISTYLGNRGDKLDRGVTVRDLVDSGLVELNAGFLRGTGVAPIKGPGPNVGTGGGGGGTTPYEPDLSPPPTPTGVTVTAGIDFLMFVTDPPLYLQGHGHGRTRVYGTTWTSGPKPTFADAKELMQFLGNVDSYPTNPATKWHIWLKWVTNDGIASTVPVGGTNGFEVTTGQDVSQLLNALQGKLRNEQLDPASNFRFKANLFTIESTTGSPSINPFTVITTPTLTPAGELLPVGVYMEAAYIKGLEAALARFQTAIITNAMIVSVSASRITSGVINVGSYIQSSNYVAGTTGWRIHGDGTAEFPAAVIRGQLSAAQMNGQGLKITRADGSVVLDAGDSIDPFKGLSVGRNLIANSDQTSAMTWGMGNVNGQIDVPLTYASNKWSDTYVLLGNTTRNVTCHQNGNNGGGDTAVCCDIYPLGNGYTVAQSVAVVPGQKYCFSAYMQAHRCFVGVGLEFFDIGGNAVGTAYSSPTATPHSWGAYQADRLAYYTRPFAMATAPANAVYARVFMRKYNTFAAAEAQESWWWGAAPQFEAVGATATGPGPYTPGPPGSTRQLGYAGDLDATKGATIGSNLFGSFDQGTFDVVMNGRSLIRLAHINTATIGNLRALAANIGVLESYGPNGTFRLQDGKLSMIAASTGVTFFEAGVL
ncbi:phage tail tip fiber protein [Roseateles chitosanitabidus]|uniref:phage tail tip fiber protein n=1 Tax=Roseateles chitosanitabidus TaxID=65048 RepID=UPI00083505BE|nr:hypothetical protein [Roseateles chitosanitabidus]